MAGAKRDGLEMRPLTSMLGRNVARVRAALGRTVRVPIASRRFSSEAGGGLSFELTDEQVESWQRRVKRVPW